MDKIEVKILNPEVIEDAKRMMVTAARLTQKGHKIHSMDDFMRLYKREFSEATVDNMVHLPHPTIQKFGVINVVVVGASRRFLAQITRHQSEVKFMSASLQYSDYTDSADFAVPYEFLGTPAEDEYLGACRDAMETYKVLAGQDNDAAGYAAPQGLRNILIISATPYQFKHMISQRVCRRNTDETRIVMLKIWEELYALDPVFFAGDVTGPFCQKSKTCPEGRMTCGLMIPQKWTPQDIMRQDFKKL